MNKRIVVVLAGKARAGEALRAAVGLTLRGDRVDLVRHVSLDETDPQVARSLAALRALGGDTEAPLSSLRSADAVEVWTDGSARRPLLDELTPDKLLDLVLAQDPVIIW